MGALKSFWKGFNGALAWRDTSKDPPSAPLVDHWDRRFIAMAGMVATWSKDRGTQVGCVVVGPRREVRSMGFNGFPRGVDDTDETLHQRPAKYLVTEHAERNAICNAAWLGVSVAGCTLYLATKPTKLGPCADCARALAQSGISRVVQEGPLSEREDWRASCEMGQRIMRDAGVVYVVASPV